MAQTFVLYLTGAPATGKSTVAERLVQEVGALCLSYGAILTERLSSRVKDQGDLRSLSAAVITPRDVHLTDQLVMGTIRQVRRTRHVVVDSHAITRETYGFRAVPYSAKELTALRYTHIVCLRASAETTLARIARDSGGRPVLSPAEFDAHTELQTSIALSYAHTLGAPIALIDSSAPIDTVVSQILAFVLPHDYNPAPLD